MAEDQDVISWSSLEGMEKTMGEEAAHALAKKLLGFLEEKVAELEKAFADNDAKAAEFCLHKLGSNAAALGALRLSQTARNMERDCIAGNWDGVKGEKDAVLTLARQSLDVLKGRFLS